MSDIHSKLAKVAGEIGSINKTERNKEQGFNFRSIEQITGAVRPLFAAEGISVAPRVITSEHSEVISKSGTKGFRAIVHMAYTFTAGSDGSSVETSMLGEAVDYGDKSTSKAVQMAYKYALTQVLQVGSGDDPDAHSVDVGHVGEAKGRQRSGPQQRSPRQSSTRATETAPTARHPDQASDIPEPSREAPDLELTRWVIKQKLALVDQLGGDKVKATQIWTDVLATYDLKPDQLPLKDSLAFIESDLAIEVGRALELAEIPGQEALLNPDEVEAARPFV
jgi:ERF superfamily protein